MRARDNGSFTDTTTQGSDMSFGDAARRTGRRLDDAHPCPCGSGLAFGVCCGPYLRGDLPPTAEALMRSRYTAFALGAADYVSGTWHPRTRPERLDLDDHQRWVRLEIMATTDGRAGDRRGTVEFRAHWSDDSGTRGVLSEVSDFVFQSGRWWYLKGAIDERLAQPEHAVPPDIRGDGDGDRGDHDPTCAPRDGSSVVMSDAPHDGHGAHQTSEGHGERERENRHNDKESEIWVNEP